MGLPAYPEKRPLQGWWFIMSTGHKPKHPLEEGLEHINPIKGQLLKIFGPADGRGNPLVGTQYDPVVRQKIETERQHERWARQDARRHGHPELRHSRLGGGGAYPCHRPTGACNTPAWRYPSCGGRSVPSRASESWPSSDAS